MSIKYFNRTCCMSSIPGLPPCYFTHGFQGSCGLFQNPGFQFPLLSSWGRLITQAWWSHCFSFLCETEDFLFYISKPWGVTVMSRDSLVHHREIQTSYFFSFDLLCDYPNVISLCQKCSLCGILLHTPFLKKCWRKCLLSTVSSFICVSFYVIFSNVLVCLYPTSNFPHAWVYLTLKSTFPLLLVL